ncbi:MAG: DUF1992 domain-containing protein [Anaerolineae bacterium]|nr:DUF1992 domain-containing protein [Thermoflexales bacterium]MDW8395685.1 DUF1992 domain-containing protein [Anaerolineae bacterium]
MTWSRLVERLLAEAHERGAFSGLPRKGALTLDEDGFIPEDERLAVHLLKSSDALPAWIEEDKALRDKILSARDALVRAYRRRQQRLCTAQTPEARSAVEAEWDRARAQFERAVAEINKDIFEFNLRAPSAVVHRLPLRLSEEYARLERNAL